MAYQDENIDFNSQLEESSPYNINSGDLEALLDIIADALIKSPLVNTNTVKNNQKFIRDGSIKIGQGEGTLALYQKDVEANIKDDLQSVANQIIGPFDVFVNEGVDDTISINISGGGFQDGGLDITNLVIGEGNPLNVSQFIPIQKLRSVVNVDKAEEFLDTNIFELLPESDSRQARIIRFFDELNTLLPPNLPNFETPVERDEEDNWIGGEEYSRNNSISYAQDRPDDTNINEEQAFIHRLKFGAVPANSQNETRTIEDIYRTIEPYLTDILEDKIEPRDDRPEYENQSSGYLQFRNPGQGIIIRNTNQEFVEGLDPSNPTFLDTGFTITMWVRFLDKASSGTLFNFGNPTRGYTSDPTAFGFKLETYVLDKEDGNFTTSNNYDNYGEAAQYIVDRDDNYIAPFENTNTARFVRLVVNDDGTLRDSHTATAAGTKMTTIWDESINGDTESKRFRRLQTTFIPEDFNEWYFICATYNPNVDEDGSYSADSEFLNNSDFWLNRVEPELGNQCKVEIISRTDLLRARGFKV